MTIVNQKIKALTNHHLNGMGGRKPTANTGLPQWGQPCKIESLCFYQTMVLGGQ